MPHRNDHVVPPPDDDDDEDRSPAFQQPVYPQITRAQWAVLVAMTTGECKNMLEGAAFYSGLSQEAKDFLRGADKEKITQLKSTIEFMNAAGIIWKFLWVGGATAFGLFIGATQLWKAIGEYLTVKFK